MLDRADITGIILVVAGSIAAVFFLAFVPQSFSNQGTTAAITFVVITVPIFSYAAYWAFSLGRALTIRLYRRQAFGIGVIVVAFWSTIGIFVGLSGALSLQVSSALSTLTWDFLLLTLFYWIDASVLASRRSDPLLRDTLYWSKLRIPLWTVDLLAVGTVFSVLSYAEITGNVSLLNQLVVGTFNNAILNFVNGFPVILAIVCGVIFLSAIAVRAKFDRTLRRHFAWFALFLILVFSVLGGPLGLIGPIGLLLAGFALYKSAKSLVPLNRLALSASD
jgi:hypothetical protein